MFIGNKLSFRATFTDKGIKSKVAIDRSSEICPTNAITPRGWGDSDIKVTGVIAVPFRG